MYENGYAITVSEEEMQHLFDCFVARKKELHLAAEQAKTAGRTGQAEELDAMYQEVAALQERFLALMQ